MAIANAARAAGIAALLAVLAALPAARLRDDDLATIKPGARTGFSNGGWSYDRYADLDSLDAHTAITVANLEGPGIIRHIHFTRHHPKELAARGVVLEIRFDGAAEPAVMCPLADFFGDGCNGGGQNFTSNLVECAPWSYNCYIPMPFAKRARVVLRNDTAENIWDYSYVEWEKLPAWTGTLGYFHATWERRCFQLLPTTRETFFEVEGAGHVVGRQFSVITDEPFFHGFNMVMEGNNEIDIDGRERAVDYLGTEDSFTFSWGFQETFAGLHAGMTLVDKAASNRLSIYRFHDHMPIRFDRSLRWTIDWSNERFLTGDARWADAVQSGGCWVDYATVFYWYQDNPGGYTHKPLPPVEERARAILRSSRKVADVGAILRDMETDANLANTFESAADVERVHVLDAYSGNHPFHIDEPAAAGGHPGNPNPGRRGILAVHSASARVPCLVVRKVALPEEDRPVLRIVTSGDPYEIPGQSDFVLQAGVHDGGTTAWFDEEVIDAGSPPAATNWRTLEYPLGKCAGRTVGIVVKVSYGGPKGMRNEEAFFDEISVVSR